jgi:hypothetical protein
MHEKLSLEHQNMLLDALAEGHSTPAPHIQQDVISFCQVFDHYLLMNKYYHPFFGNRNDNEHHGLWPYLLANSTLKRIHKCHFSFLRIYKCHFYDYHMPNERQQTASYVYSILQERPDLVG